MNTSLDVEIIDGRLLISIGIETLAWASDHSDLSMPYNTEANDFVPKWKVIDPLGFATDVARELRREAEDGSSLLTRVLDKALEEAIEQGSLSVEEQARPLTGQPLGDSDDITVWPAWERR